MSKFDLVKLMWYHNKVRWKVRRLSGAPPLSFKGRGKNLKNYRIYGQSSRNLFDGNFMHKHVSREFVVDDNNYGRSIVIDISSFNNGDKITFSRKNIAGSRLSLYQISSLETGGRIYTDSLVLPAVDSLSVTFTIANGSNYPYLMIYLNDNNTAITDEELLSSNIMLNSGSTALPYETYGESVGDRTENLFDISKATRDVGYTYDGNGDYVASNASNTIMGFIAVDENTTYTIKNTDYPPYRVHYFDINKQWISRTNPLHGTEISPGMTVEFTTPNNSKYIIMQELNANRMNISTIMLNSGSEPLPYEPYGYRVPVTVTNGTDTQTTNLYLPEQIKMVGDEAEYVDFGEQKQHFADGTSVDVTLPALPTFSGTNTLSVGTQVQPSEVYVEGKIRFIHEGSGENEGE